MNPLEAWDTGADTSTEVRSPTSTRTEVRSPTSTDAYTQGNFTATVTGGAGAGATHVNIYPGHGPAPTPREARAAPNPQVTWAKLFGPSDTGGLEETPNASFPLLFIIGVGGVLIWATLDSEKKRKRARA